jgi:hypothetical protein
MCIAKASVNRAGPVSNFRLALHSGNNYKNRSGRPIFQETILRAPTASVSQIRRIFFPMSMTCKERPRYEISIHALKYTLATLIQGVASALRHQFFEHASHCFYSIHQIIQLRKLSLGERAPAFRSASDVAKTKEQVSDFSQCKTELTRTLNDCQPVKRCSVVSSLPAHSRGLGKQSNSLVVPNRRCLESNLSRHLGNR